jgi:cell division protein FtsB
MICLLLSSYFAYHSMIGRHGLNSHQKALETTASLELKLANLQEESAKLKKRVKLLMDGSIEYDMLDEQARYHLNLIQDDEIVIMRVIK